MLYGFKNVSVMFMLKARVLRNRFPYILLTHILVVATGCNFEGFSFYICSIDSLNLVSLQVARSWSQFLIVSKNQLLTGILKSVFKFCFVKNWLIPLESSFIHCNLEIPESTYLGFQSFICLKICLFVLYWKYGLSLWTIPRHKQDSIFMILNILQIFYNF